MKLKSLTLLFLAMFSLIDLQGLRMPSLVTSKIKIEDVDAKPKPLWKQRLRMFGSTLALSMAIPACLFSLICSLILLHDWCRVRVVHAMRQDSYNWLLENIRLRLQEGKSASEIIDLLSRGDSAYVSHLSGCKKRSFHSWHKTKELKDTKPLSKLLLIIAMADIQAQLSRSNLNMGARILNMGLRVETLGYREAANQAFIYCDLFCLLKVYITKDFNSLNSSRPCKSTQLIYITQRILALSDADERREYLRVELEKLVPGITQDPKKLLLYGPDATRLLCYTGQVSTALQTVGEGGVAARKLYKLCKTCPDLKLWLNRLFCLHASTGLPHDVVSEVLEAVGDCRSPSDILHFIGEPKT